VGGTITRAYDGLDRLTSETTPEGSISYTYDTNGRRTGMTVAGQPAITYAYDNADRLMTITQGAAVTTFANDNANRRTSLTLPSGVTTSYTYDAASRLTGLTYTLNTTTLGTLLYGYDTSGNRQVVGGTWTRTGLPSLLEAATYNAANRQLTFGTQTLTYDLNSNLTSDGTSTYTWDARDRLAAITGPGPASFVYDGAGRRRAKTIGGTTTNFLYDGLNPVQEQAGSSIRNLLTGLGVDEFLTRDDGAGALGFLGDALGTTLALVDVSGIVQATYTYDPFGGTTVSGAPGANALSYTGREDDGAGLKYYRARYYHSGLQRFLSEDPIEFAGGDFNLYAYVGNNSPNLRDPRGLFIDPVTTTVAIVTFAALVGLVVGGDQTPVVLTGRSSHDEPSQYVVRAGLAKPDDLIKGTGPHRDIPGLTGFSVQHAPGVSIDELARGGRIPNLQISVTTVPILRQHGINVVYPTPGRGEHHATVQTPYPLTPEQAALLSTLFVRQPNPHPYRPR
jgi:RHS repeat-associated protein